MPLTPPGSTTSLSKNLNSNFLLQYRERFGAGGRRQDAITERRQHLADGLSDIGMVLDDEDRRPYRPAHVTRVKGRVNDRAR